MTDWAMYRGQWGGKTESGEELWWSEPARSGRVRDWLFTMDVRQHFILRFWKRFAAEKKRSARGLTGLSVVDYGCGTGGTTLNFSRMIGHSISGYDIFETQIRIARDFAQNTRAPDRPRCEFGLLGAQGEIPKAEGSVDAILSIDVLGHVPDIPIVLSHFQKALSPGGAVLLFIEATYSEGDRSVMAKLAKKGLDMAAAVPEHISLYPREQLEQLFEAAGFEVRERFSANLGHFVFFPKDYCRFLKSRGGHPLLLLTARTWHRVSKLAPFYPWPFQFLRLAATHFWGRGAYGTSYFYDLRKVDSA